MNTKDFFNEDGSFDWGKFFAWEADENKAQMDFMGETIKAVMLKNLELEKEIARLREKK
jgi:hypothetical protein